ncbi:ArsR/SmtB family transcription factor [Paenibacillus apiarius]|uniref:Winged helix-turn-helix domain-containing protein n=1 Tax=Paenibacillus apiarius TaxID=46240 RepID=A0ABT4E015_9BACL|nr:winged helix-turn-helix domain-containing protein [Paenibacillus apiarius]MCY9515065.1 winged helix-turn-helix domain-containing protein [Paenibacillus apiarius]MCY9522949.1 winged helix-turn-helix domain-containing protein [Paenibacillus apiarius]MCY9553752.1 winged helix-turn-helix domain-containing protein [Paenibacillus apiarius]MCY9556415.1 winged helix-turn-helix domain-containing protein [Paenibacillus apiarius]MCY9684849.1 winged helix-turn-helix domain-containing protein [Paenibaci
MRENKIIDDIELAKILLDPRRIHILRLAQHEPVTVKQMAEEMNEKPSRLYYHVKKLEEAHMLELVETKQQGNLIEKYYRSNNEHRSFTFGKQLTEEYSSYIVQEMLRITHQGMDLIEEGMRKGEFGKSTLAEANIAYASLTPMEWAEKTHHVLNVISPVEEKPPFEPAASDIAKDAELSKQTAKDDYVFVMLSYRLKDAPDRPDESDGAEA